MIAREFSFAAGLIGVTALTAWQPTTPATTMSNKDAKRIEARVYYAGCNEVRALGKAPLYAGQPGYRIGMDGDGDGIACEPHQSNRRYRR